MFQFSELASFRIITLQVIRLSHSEIQGYIACVQLPPAYRSLPRPSSPLRPKASTMRPYFALKILHFKVTTLLHFTTQYVKELLYTTLRLYTLLISAKETILNNTHYP